VFLLRFRFGPAGFPGHVRNPVIAIALGTAAIYAGQHAACSSHCRRIGAFGFGHGMGFYTSDVAISAWLLRSLVVLVHGRNSRQHFIFLALWRSQVGST